MPLELSEQTLGNSDLRFRFATGLSGVPPVGNTPIGALVA
jgi:hypothetical protein